jgi:hypothetical protein
MLGACASLALAIVIVATSGGVVVRASTVCYQCAGVSGLSNLSAVVTNCGSPFKDNSSLPLPTVLCEGVCVTQVIYFYYGRLLDALFWSSDPILMISFQPCLYCPAGSRLSSTAITIELSILLRFRMQCYEPVIKQWLPLFQHSIQGHRAYVTSSWSIVYDRMKPQMSSRDVVRRL